MPNPILQMLNKQAGNSSQMGNLNSIKQMINKIKSAGNPNAMLANLAKSNPNVQYVMNLVNQSNGDAKTAFYNLAKEKGIDPNEIINMLK